MSDSDPKLFGVWDVAYDHAIETMHYDPSWQDSSDRAEYAGTYAEGAEWGAGWAFAIVGMAQAIRDADAARKADAWANTGEHAAAIARAFDPDDPVGGDDVVVRGPPTARR
jgi:hypothetical protein